MFKDLRMQERDTGNCQGFQDKSCLLIWLVGSGLKETLLEVYKHPFPIISSPGLPNSFHCFPYIVSTFIPFVFT